MSPTMSTLPISTLTHGEYQCSVAALIELVEAAGQGIMEIYAEKDFSIRAKSDDSPVTLADLRSHEILVEGLDQLSPDIAVVSEESADSLLHRQQKKCYWLLDPLDGTKEFIARNGEFTVNVALIDGERVIFGLVFLPVTGELYLGGKSIGAWKGIQGSFSALSVKPPGNPLRIMASKSHLNPQTQAIVDRYDSPILLQAGSSLKFCRIAEGLADLYPRLAPTCEWDTAAAQAILEGAGGGVYQLTGEPLVYSKPEVLNPNFIALGDPGLIDFPVLVNQ